MIREPETRLRLLIFPLLHPLQQQKRLKAVRNARLVVTMGEEAAATVRMRYPGAKVIAFHPPVSDPYGGSMAVYRATAAELDRQMPWVLQQLTQTEK